MSFSAKAKTIVYLGGMAVSMVASAAQAGGIRAPGTDVWIVPGLMEIVDGNSVRTTFQICLDAAPGRSMDVPFDLEIAESSTGTVYVADGSTSLTAKSDERCKTEELQVNDLPAGYYLVNTFADPGNTIRESNENNNSSHAEFSIE